MKVKYLLLNSQEEQAKPAVVVIAMVVEVAAAAVVGEVFVEALQDGLYLVYVLNKVGSKYALEE